MNGRNDAILKDEKNCRETSIIAQVAFKSAVELCIAGKITFEELETQAKRNFLVIRNVAENTGDIGL